MVSVLQYEYCNGILDKLDRLLYDILTAFSFTFNETYHWNWILTSLCSI